MNGASVSLPEKKEIFLSSLANWEKVKLANSWHQIHSTMNTAAEASQVKLKLEEAAE